MGYFIEKIKNRRQGLLSKSTVFRSYKKLIAELDTLISRLEDEKQPLYSKAGLIFTIDKNLKVFERINTNEKQLNVFEEKIIDKLDNVDHTITQEYYLEKFGKVMEVISQALGQRLYTLPRLVTFIEKHINNKLVDLWDEVHTYYKIQEEIDEKIDIIENVSLRLRQRKKIVFRQRLDNYKRMLSHKSFRRVSEMLDAYSADFEAAREKNDQDIEESTIIIRDLFSRLENLKEKYPDYYNANDLESVQNNLLRLRGEANMSKYVLDKINNHDVEVYTIERELPMLNFSKEILDQRKSNFNHTVDMLSARTQDIGAVRQLKSRVRNLRIDLESVSLKRASDTILDAKDKLISNIV